MDQAKPPAPRSGLLGNENFRWLCVTVLLPLLGWIWGQHLERMNKEETARALALAKAEAQAREQDAIRRQGIEVLIRLLPDINAEPFSARQTNALSVMAAMKDQGQLPSTLTAALHGNIERLNAQTNSKGLFDNPEARRQSESLAPSFVSSEQIQTDGAVPQPSLVTGARIYLQIYDETQRAAALSLQQSLRSAGFAVPGIENVTATAAARLRPPPTNHGPGTVRYFKARDRDAALQVAALARQAQPPLALEVKDLSAQPVFKNVPLGQLELWFPLSPPR
ncbi:MAG: hypothetical protein J0M20_06815 [Burkholderiales bacterium]|nr:hypothetical protein [Burkholderiales bacterium]